MNEKLTTMGKAAQTASRQLSGLLTTQKNETLLAIAASLENNVATLLAANEKDLKQSACSRSVCGSANLN